MATVTNEIIQNQYGAEGSFTLITTPVGTGTYADTGSYGLIVNAVFPLVLLFWANLGNQIADQAKEDNEEKLENILKRIGYRPIVEVYRSFIVMALTILIVYTPAALIVLFLTLPGVNVFIGLVFFYMIPIEMWIIDMNFDFVFGKRALIIKALYYISSLFLQIMFQIRPIMTNEKMFVLSLFPLT